LKRTPDHNSYFFPFWNLAGRSSAVYLQKQKCSEESNLGPISNFDFFQLLSAQQQQAFQPQLVASFRKKRKQVTAFEIVFKNRLYAPELLAG
jgi:hypothetical protein